MNTLNKHNHLNKKRLVIFLAFLIILLGGAISFALYRGSSNSSDQEEDTANLRPTQKEEAVRDNDAANKGEFIEKSQKPDESSTPTPSTENVTLTATNQGDSVIVMTKLVGIQSGECTLVVSGSTQTITESADIIYAPDFSNCAGFSIDKNRVDGPLWNIELQIKTEGTVLTKTIKHTL